MKERLYANVHGGIIDETYFILAYTRKMHGN